MIPAWALAILNLAGFRALIHSRGEFCSQKFYSKSVWLYASSAAWWKRTKRADQGTLNLVYPFWVERCWQHRARFNTRKVGRYHAVSASSALGVSPTAWWEEHGGKEGLIFQCPYGKSLRLWKITSERRFFQMALRAKGFENALSRSICNSIASSRQQGVVFLCFLWMEKGKMRSFARRVGGILQTVQRCTHGDRFTFCKSWSWIRARPPPDCNINRTCNANVQCFTRTVSHYILRV